jgi:hypothetical protein
METLRPSETSVNQQSTPRNIPHNLKLHQQLQIIFPPSSLNINHIQGDQKVSAHLMITVQKSTQKYF